MVKFLPMITSEKINELKENYAVFQLAGIEKEFEYRDSSERIRNPTEEVASKVRRIALNNKETEDLERRLGVSGGGNWSDYGLGGGVFKVSCQLELS